MTDASLCKTPDPVDLADEAAAVVEASDFVARVGSWSSAVVAPVDSCRLGTVKAAVPLSTIQSRNSNKVAHIGCLMARRRP